MSRDLNIAYLVLMSGCIWLLSQISTRLLVLIYPSLESSSGDKSSIEDKIDSSSYELRWFYTKPPSSNCTKVIM